VESLTLAARTRTILIATFLMLLLALSLAACGGEANPTPTVIIPTATVEPESTPTKVATPTVGEAEATESATAVATSSPVVPTPDPASQNIFGSILGPVGAPEGWRVEPCAGNGPFLCIFTGDEHLGNVELSFFPVVTLPEFQGMLTSAGVVSATFDYRDSEQRAKATVALRAFVDNYHSIFEEDRKTLYGETARYNRLETRQVAIGALPGVGYGFSIVKQDESVAERWLLYSAFDGDILYTIVAHYMPDSIGTFPSDEQLVTFEPHFAKIATGLRLPVQVVETEVTSVEALAATEIFPAPIIGSANPVATVQAGQTLQVSGKTANGQWWRVPCPAEEARYCWMTADPKVTRP
jgi:hypothetical protein